MPAILVRVRVAQTQRKRELERGCERVRDRQTDAYRESDANKRESDQQERVMPVRE